MASVRKRKWTHKGETGEAWIVDYADEAGNRRQKTFKLKKDADRYRVKVEGELAEGTHTPASQTVTVAQAVEEWLRDNDRRHQVGDHMSGYTLKNYAIYGKKFSERFGRAKLTELSRFTVQEWLNTLSKDYKPATIRRVYAVIYNTLRFAILRGWMKTHPILEHGPRLPPMGLDRVRVPTRENIQSLLTFGTTRSQRAGPRQDLTRRAIVLLGVVAGLRRGEMAGLQWENIDFERRVIRVRHSLSAHDGLKAPKTKCGVRDVPMAEPVAEVLTELAAYWQLREWMWARRTPSNTLQSMHNMFGVRWRRGDRVPADWPPITGYVLRLLSLEPGQGFCEDWAFGRPMTVEALSTSQWFHICEDAGLLRKGKPLFSMHAMRHAFASLLIESGLPAFNLKAVIGHATVATTHNIYGHLFPDDTRTAEAISGIAGRFLATNERQAISSV